jgi:regulator of sirC expression with transglutaminase-like and TPR domain
MYACELAIRLSPRSANIRDSRGLARALTGNRQGAIDDFNYFIQMSNNPSSRQRRRQWVKILQAGGNPFTPQELEALKQE